MLSDDFTEVLASRDRDDLFASVLRFAHRLGFERMTAMAVLDLADGTSTFASVDNAPPACRLFHDSLAQARLDPVMQHCKRSGVPIVWNQGTYVAAGRAAKWECQAPYGYKTGVAVALHLPFGRHFFVGFDREQPLPADCRHLTRVVADLQLFAALAQETAHRVLLSEVLPHVASHRLTARELETLQWTMEGKTAWEVSRILSISEQTAVRHLNNATHKLGCTNKHQAAIRALRLGLIT
jgi:DNA-binding CsgD family transcriptional regulator